MSVAFCRCTGHCWRKLVSPIDRSSQVSCIGITLLKQFACIDLMLNVFVLVKKITFFRLERCRLDRGDIVLAPVDRPTSASKVFCWRTCLVHCSPIANFITVCKWIHAAISIVMFSLNFQFCSIFRTLWRAFVRTFGDNDLTKFFRRYMNTKTRTVAQ